MLQTIKKTETAPGKLM